MTYSKRKLEQELAEVSAGRRTDVSFTVQSNVSAEEYRDRQRTETHEAEMRRAGAAQLQATQEGLRLAEQANRLGEEALRQAELHNREMAQAAKDELAFQQRAHDDVMLVAEYEAQEKEQQAERGKKASSSTYAGVVQLRKLRLLEQIFQDAEEVENIFKPAIAVLATIASALEKAGQERGDALALAKTAEAAAMNDRASQVAAEQLVMQDLVMRLEENKQELHRYRVTLRPLTWQGEYAQRRQELMTIASELESKIHSKRQEIETLARTPSRAPEPVDTWDVRAERVKTACREVGAAETVATIDAAIYRLRFVDGCSEELHHLFDGEHEVASDEFEIDLDLCHALDKIRSKTGAAVSYPDLGPVPYDDDLVATIVKIKSMEKRLPRFADPEYDYRGKPPKGFNEYHVVRLAVDYGYFPGGPEEKLMPTYFLKREPILLYAASIIYHFKDARDAILQQYLRIGPQRADYLMRQLRLCGIVEDKNSDGTRDIRVHH